MKKIIIVFTLLFVSFCFAGKAETQETASPRHNGKKNVLLINSYHQVCAWNLGLMEGIEPYLYSSNFDLTIVYLDESRIPYTPEREQKFKENFRSNYENHHFDMVVTVDEPAFVFLEHNYPSFEFLHNLPVICIGLTNVNQNDVVNLKDAFLFEEHVGYEKTVQLAKDLFPKTKVCYVLNDYTVTGQSIRKLLETNLSQLFPKIEFVYNDDLKYVDIIRQIESLPKNAVVLLGTYGRDKEKDVLSKEAVIEMLAATGVPIFCLYGDYLNLYTRQEDECNNTIIGGSVIFARAQGDYLGKMVEYYFQNNEMMPEAVTPLDFSKTVLNYNGLKAFKIYNRYHFFNATLINKPETWVTIHAKDILFIGLLILLILFIVSFALFINQLRLHQRAEQYNQLLERIQKFFDIVPVGIAEFSKDFTICQCSKFIQKFLGLDPDKVIGYKFLSNIQEPKNLSAANELYQDMLAGRHENEFLTGSIISNGQERYCMWIYSALRDKNNDVLGYFALLKDITEEKELIDKTRNLANQNEQLRINHDRFMANYMHSFKNLMTPLVAYTEMMMSGLLSGEKMTLVAEQLNWKSNMIVQMCTELMNINRIRGGYTNIQPAQINLYKILQEYLFMTESHFDRKQIAVHNKLNENQTVWADPETVSSIFLNLLTNAIKFTNTGGEIKIEGEIVDNEWYAVSIIDNGVGLKDENLLDTLGEKENISQPSTEGELGTGMGLILVKDLVEKNGGKLTGHNNTDGSGATFTFTLPLQKPIE